MTVFYAPLLPAAADLLAELPAFELAASSNITASGEATTAQLTSPGGSFTAGRLQDDENPADSVDIGSGGYTELEWCIQATADAETSAEYEFRVVADGVALDTYTATPAWTIDAGGGGGFQVAWAYRSNILVQ